MAYLEPLQEMAGTFSSPAPPPHHDPDQTTIIFSPLEWSIIDIAREDRLSSTRPPTVWGMLAARIFGEQYNPQLANPKLEALRRMAVLTWHHGYMIAETEIWDFIRAGYSVEHYDLLAKEISFSRNLNSNRNKRS